MGKSLFLRYTPSNIFFENGFSFQKQNYDKLTSYFETEPNHYPKGLDYFGNVEYESSEGFWFMHKVSEIITAILHNGIEIETFDEYPLDLDGNPEKDVEGKLPQRVEKVVFTTFSRKHLRPTRGRPKV